MRDTGATLSPFNAFILLQGLETLSLRLERHVSNALKVVEYLSKHPQVEKVNHPVLESHPQHALYKKYFPLGAGSIFTFEIKGGKDAASIIVLLINSTYGRAFKAIRDDEVAAEAMGIIVDFVLTHTQH